MIREFLKTRRKNEALIREIYAKIVAQARHPTFYTDYDVPDTLDGRFNMIVLHYFLLYKRLNSAGPLGAEIGQKVFDTFRLDMDRSLRELGVGDTTVPKKMKKMMQVFYGRMEAYDRALSDQEPARLRPEGPMTPSWD